MLTEGNLLYFDPFYFPNGKSAPKPKYMIVLSCSNGFVLATLPTRTDNLPSAREKETGCISFEMSTDGFDMVCYKIEAEMQIPKNSTFSFPFPTHIYGHQLQDYDEQYFELYPFEGTDYQIVGMLKTDILSDLRSCLKNNPSVKRKYKNKL